MFNWFKKNKNQKKKITKEPIMEPEEETKEIVPIIEEETMPISIPDFVSIKDADNEVGAVFNTDGMTEQEKEEFYQEFSKRSDIPIFKGKIEFGYSLANAKSEETCPKCSGKLNQHYADFVYSNGEVSRVNTSPFGYFCEDCPSVVIDIKKLKGGLPHGVSFHGIAGVNTSESGLMLFKLWDNEKPVFILDEDQNMMGVTTKSEMKKSPKSYDDFYRSWEGETDDWKPSPTAVKKKNKSRKRNKSAKKSRRNNRRKK